MDLDGDGATVVPDGDVPRLGVHLNSDLAQIALADTNEEGIVRPSGYGTAGRWRSLRSR